jgi:hypothetical protein
VVVGLIALQAVVVSDCGGAPLHAVGEWNLCVCVCVGEGGGGDGGRERGEGHRGRCVSA